MFEWLEGLLPDRASVWGLLFGAAAMFGSPTVFEQMAKPIMQVLLSVVLLGASLYIVLSAAYQPTDKYWAYGIIGTLVGYWLGPTVRGQAEKAMKEAKKTERAPPRQPDL